MEDVKNLVVIKSNKQGLLIHLDGEASYSDLLLEIKEKFKEAAKFFSGAKLTISFEGRHLTKEEEWEIVNLISSSAHIHILCIIDCDEKENHHLESSDYQDGQFYKGTLRKRQVLESEKSITILGDVEAGATVVAKGNVIVLGCLNGFIHAGAAGNKHAFISALQMQAPELKIADCFTRRVFKEQNEEISSMEPKIAFADGKHIYIDPLV